MKIIRVLYVFIFLLSCQKEIKVNLNSGNPKIAIEANFCANDSTVRVKINQTVDYFDVFEVNNVNDAIVTINEENKSEINVDFISNGYYELKNFIPKIGSNYIMTVSYNGIKYQADSKLQQTLILSEPKIEFQEETIFSEQGYIIYYTFQDFQGLGNCYKMIPTYNKVRKDKFGDFSIGQDKLTDGNLIQRRYFEVFQIDDTVIFELQSINQKVYDYYDQLQSTGSPMNAAVGNPNYFWTNEAFGYFSAYSYSIDTIVIK